MNLTRDEPDACLHPDPTRVVARLFLPGEGVPSTRSRAAEIVDRVLAIPDQQLHALVTGLRHDFHNRHIDIDALLNANATALQSRVDDLDELSPDRRLILGAAFTAEYAVEAAALCNPSATPHPDQSGLTPGQVRVAITLRAIGEGHVSSIEFAEAIIGPGRQWRFLPRAAPLTTATIRAGAWQRSHLRSALEHEGTLNELSSAVLAAIPEDLSAADVERALTDLPADLTAHRESATELAVLRAMVGSTYQASFDTTTAVSQRVLLPSAVEEFQGMEDARVTRFTSPDQRAWYEITYTAYDGRDIAPRLLRSSDLATLHAHRLTGSGARNKGMALFPRHVSGRRLALTRTDGETISLAASEDGLHWMEEATIHGPTETWELVQTGNCGPPIETPDGWLVLTHGVGPMRSYALGALLLDLDAPENVLARTIDPLLHPDRDRQNGYVPNVLYSCGPIAHDGTLWVPYGIGDARVRVLSIDIGELIASMTTQAADAVAPRR